MIDRAPVYWYDDIDSTSEEAKRRARRAETSAFWIAARQQNAGKGRLGRTWASPLGNLYTTVLIPEPGGLTVAARVPFAAALAVRDACASFIPSAQIGLKWPNDVRVNGKKLSGILTESGETHGVVWIALGIGLNVQHAPEGVGQETTSLVREGAVGSLQPDLALQALSEALQGRIEQARNDFEGLLEDWLKYAEGLGQTVQAGAPDNRIEGIFEGLAPDGGLILRLPDGATHIIRAGDVDLVKQVN